MSDENKRQESVFRDGEGDAWFERNRQALDNKRGETDWPVRMLDQLVDDEKPTSILELGCANGWRLARLRDRALGQRHVGVEISVKAVEDGTRQYPDLELHQGSIVDVPLIGDYDVVIVNFVLHWVDRSLLSRAVAEIDRLTKDGGYLLIGDFYPDYPVKRHYGHLENDDVHTFKQDYSKMFEAFGTYRKAAMVSTASGATDAEPVIRWCDHQERTGFTLLRKSLEGFYLQQR